jgi:hypothetical protein
MGNPILLFDTRLTRGNVQASDPLAQSTADAMINTRLYQRWEAVTTAPQSIRIDCGNEADINAIGIAGHNLKSAGCTITVAGGTMPFTDSGGGGSVVTVVSGFYALTNRAILRTFSVTRRRYWCISFGRAIVPVWIGSMKLGRCLELPYPPDTPYAPREVSQAAEVMYSKAGQPLGVIRGAVSLKTNVRVSLIDRDWALKGWGDFTWREIPWANYGWLSWLEAALLSMEGMFYAWDPAIYPHDVIFGMFDGEGDLSAPLTYAHYINSYGFMLISNKDV